jgi:hypothetical protein
MRDLQCFLGLVLLASVAFGAEPSWRPLFNGKDLSGWDTFMSKPDPAWDVPGMKRDEKGDYTEPVGTNRDPLRVFVVEDVDGEPAIHISGQGFGVMTTVESFENVHLRLQIKWGDRRWGKKATAPRDSGLLYFVHGDAGAVDGNWPRSIECQIQEHDMGDLYALGTQITVPARKADNLWLYDPKGEPTVFVQRRPIGNRSVRLEDAEKPKGEWNTLELICLNGDSIHVVNGKVVMRLSHAQRLDGLEPASLTAGRISLQTEGAEVFYRHVEIRAITEVPAEFSAR